MQKRGLDNCKKGGRRHEERKERGGVNGRLWGSEKGRGCGAICRWSDSISSTLYLQESDLQLLSGLLYVV